MTKGDIRQVEKTLISYIDAVNSQQHEKSLSFLSEFFSLGILIRIFSQMQFKAKNQYLVWFHINWKPRPASPEKKALRIMIYAGI